MEYTVTIALNRIFLFNAGSQPKIVSSYQKEQWLLAGDTLRVICPVDSNPAPIVTWKKDGDDIHIGWERFRIRENALQIKAVESGDSGIYVCSATNGFGTVSAQFAICVSGIIKPCSRFLCLIFACILRHRDSNRCMSCRLIYHNTSK